jgi:hypothetical protein
VSQLRGCPCLRYQCRGGLWIESDQSSHEFSGFQRRRTLDVNKSCCSARNLTCDAACDYSRQQVAREDGFPPTR